MRINFNSFAQNTAKNLFSTEGRLYETMEKLSSGLRINKAADDAAGMAISEKMRGHISGLNQAFENAQDGISLIQTAEGSMDRIHSILRRLKDLSISAANGEKTDEDRANYQLEVDQLLDELDRISNTTEYNTRKLLSGALGVKLTEDLSQLSPIAQSTGTPGAIADSEIVQKAIINDSVSLQGLYTLRVDSTFSDADYSNANSTQAAIPNVTASTPLYSAFDMGVNETETITILQPKTDKIARITLPSNLSIAEGIDEIQKQIDYQGLNIKVAWDPTVGNGCFDFTAKKRGTLFDFSISSSNSSGNNSNTDNAIFDMDDPATNITGTGKDISITVFAPDGSVETLTSNSSQFKSDIITNDKNVVFDNTGGSQGIVGLSFELDIDSRDKNGSQNYITGLEISGSMEFQVGSEQGFDNRITLNINSTSTQALSISNLDISNQEDAQNTIDSEAIDNAISLISNYRANLGATQNRLEYTITNLSINKENLGYAESRIRDTDIAAETTVFTKEQIMQQAGTAMLSQANEITKSTLQLLS